NTVPQQGAAAVSMDKVSTEHKLDLAAFDGPAISHVRPKLDVGQTGPEAWIRRIGPAQPQGTMQPLRTGQVLLGLGPSRLELQLHHVLKRVRGGKIQLVHLGDTFNPRTASVDIPVHVLPDTCLQLVNKSLREGENLTHCIHPQLSVNLSHRRTPRCS